MPAGRRAANGGRRKAKEQDEGPKAVYKELLLDAATSGDFAGSERPLKRRRKNDVKASQPRSKPTAEADVAPSQASANNVVQNDGFSKQEQLTGNDTSDNGFNVSITSRQSSPQAEQIVFDDSGSSEESDVDWEAAVGTKKEDSSRPQSRDSAASGLRLELEEAPKSAPSRRAVQRLPTTTIEKSRRLVIHKLHICCLLAHLHFRNAWCNDYRVQNILKNSINPRTKGFLNPKKSLSQHDRTKQFHRGLDEASHAWRGSFVIDRKGSRKPQWPTTLPEPVHDKVQRGGLDDESERANFMRAAANPHGSRDTGTQLFCALLRSAGVDARLVCSLQPLSFTAAAPAVTPTPQKATVDLTSTAQLFGGDSDFAFDSTASEGSNASAPQAIRRFGGRRKGNESLDLGKAPPTKKHRRIVDSPYPVYWVEAFNAAKQAWVPVDPFATRTVNKPQAFEPPLGDPANDFNYVIAFNEDGTAKDVTRRYAKAYNAKTRKNRVENSEGGMRWFRRAMRIFRDPQGEGDQDAIENAELDRREAQEPMPRSVIDFKDHPYYALERHLKRNEVLQARREVGKLRTGKAADAVESVLRRRDVQLGKSADKWYRAAGRELKPGEQPLKRVKRPRRRGRSLSPEDGDEDGDGETLGLYVFDQTQLYVPPPVVRGRVPKNVYGNLDLFVSSMIPPGAVHIRSSDGLQAARTLGISYAEAVTGFQFKGRKGTAIVKGVVVAGDYREAMEEVVESLRYQRAKADQEKRSRVALNLWKRFFTGLKIRERIMTADNDKGGAVEENQGSEESGSEYEDDENAEDAGGGFLVEEVGGPAARPTRGVERDPIVEKFQDDFAEIINDDPQLRTREYWEPTITSPWDVPGLLHNPNTEADPPEVPALKQSDTIDQLFEDIPEGGGFVPEGDPAIEAAAANPSNTATSHDLHGQPNRAPVNLEGAVEEMEEDTISQEVLNATAAPANIAEPPQVSDMGPQRQNPKPDRGLHETTPVTVQAEGATHINSESKVRDGEENTEDTDSLLSEDPEDADAEPEWLADEAGF